MKKELFRYYSAVTEREMSAVVITPDTDGEHPILYALHGYWGDEHSLSDDSEICSVIEECLPDYTVVFPYIYISRSREKCTALDLLNSTAYDSFIFELTSALIPAVEKKYRLKDRERAICGFSMGGREALYIAFMRPDLFFAVGAAWSRTRTYTRRRQEFPSRSAERGSSVLVLMRQTTRRYSSQPRQMTEL